MNDSLPQDPLRSLIDTSLEDDEIDDYNDDGDHTPTTPKHSENQTQRRQDTRTSAPLLPNPTITTLPTTSHQLHHQHHYFSSLTSNTSHSNNAVPITPLHYIPYVHGGYSAAAPLFVSHSKFAFILKKLLPGAYEELSILLRACEIRATDAATTGHRGNNDVEASSGGGRKYCREQSTNMSIANHCDNNLESNLDIMINNTTLSIYNSAMNQTEKRIDRSSSPKVTIKSSSSIMWPHMKDEKNTIPVSAGAKSAADTAQVILSDPVKSE